MRVADDLGGDGIDLRVGDRALPRAGQLDRSTAMATPSLVVGRTRQDLTSVSPKATGALPDVRVRLL